MAANLVPSSWFASWAEDGTNITVPIATFLGLTAADADGTTGDIRQIVYSIMETIANGKLVNLNNNTMPANLDITSAATFDGDTNTITKVYTVTVKTEVATVTILDEPSE